MDYIDLKYISRLSPHLPKFAKKGDYLYNFRCPYCGDSQKNKNKARGYIFRKKNNLTFKCHNCGTGASLPNLIKYVNPNLYEEYTLEKYKEGKTSQGRGGKGSGNAIPNPKFNFETPKLKKRLGNLKTFKELEKNHPARQIISKRALSEEALSDIYFCPKFLEFTNSQVKNKFPNLENDHPRLILPFRDKDGNIFAYQGRAFGDEKPKYITIILDEDHPKRFGVNRLKPNEDILVVEGPIDSLFLPNAIAVAQSDLRTPEYKDRSILIPDNEPRNKEIVKQLENCIDDGYRVVIWPETITEKDINDMVLGGIPQKELVDIIRQNTYQGLSAKNRLVNWKKI
jgi:transcription elongation factor Elf1